MSSSDPEQPNPYGGQPPYGQQQPPPYNPYQQQQYPPSGYPPGYPPYQTAPPNDGLGLAAMIIGIVSLVGSCLYGVGLLGAPAALIMGRISMKRIDRSNGQLGGRGMAQAGFILGIIGSIFLALAIIALVVIIAVAIAGGFDSQSTY